MVLLGREAELFRDVDRLDVRVVLDVVEAQELVDRGHVERPVPERDPGWLGQLLHHRADGAVIAVIGDFVDPARGAGTDVELALVPARHLAGPGETVRPELDLESLRKRNLVERDVARRGDGALDGEGRLLRIRVLGTLPLFPDGGLLLGRLLLGLLLRGLLFLCGWLLLLRERREYRDCKGCVHPEASGTVRPIAW